MARRRHRNDEGLITQALSSNWQFSAILAGGSAFAALVVIPAVFGQNPFLRPLVTMLSQLAWLLAAILGLIAFFRFFGARSTAAAVLRVETRSQQHTAGSRGWTAAPRPTAPHPINVAWGATSSAQAPAIAPRPTAWSQELLDQVEWRRFEDLGCAFYREKGIRAETTRLGADGGIDVRLFQDETAPERMTAIVQCKAWNQQVGVKEIRELRGVMAHEKVEKAFFMAPQGFTDDARAFAQANRINLLDGKLFLAMIQRLPMESSQRLLAFATAGEWTTPSCPSCGTKMVARESKRGPFWGCPTYPQCRGKLSMRAQAAKLGSAI